MESKGSQKWVFIHTVYDHISISSEEWAMLLKAFRLSLFNDSEAKVRYNQLLAPLLNHINQILHPARSASI